MWGMLRAKWHPSIGEAARVPKLPVLCSLWSHDWHMLCASLLEVNKAVVLPTRCTLHLGWIGIWNVENGKEQAAQTKMCARY